MSLTGRKITAFTKKVTDLPDRPSPSYSASQIKSQFDSSPEELRVAVNGAIDDLTSTTAGSSGSEQVASAPITGVTGTTVYGQLSNIKTQLDTNPNNFANIAVSGQPTVAATAKGDTVNLAGGTGITVTTNATSKTATITATGSATPGAHASAHVTGGTDVIANAVASGNAGLMSGADKANLDALSQKGEPFGVTAGTGTAYTVTATPAITSLVDGVSVVVKWHVVSGANPTIATNGLAAKLIWKSNGSVPAAGALKQDAIATLRYSSTANAGSGAFILQGEGGAEGTVTPDKVLTGTTYTDPATGNLTNGTMPENGALTVTPTAAAQNFGAGHYTGITVGAASSVKSVQELQASISAASAAITVTISAVDLTKTIVIITTQANSAGASAADLSVTAKLTTSTNLQLSRNATANACTVKIQVIEFNNVKSLQKGTMTSFSTSSSSVTISAVDLTKAMLIFTFNTNTVTPKGSIPALTGLLNSSTSILIDGNWEGFSIQNAEWQVIEFL